MKFCFKYSLIASAPSIILRLRFTVKKAKQVIILLFNREARQSLRNQTSAEHTRITSRTRRNRSVANVSRNINRVFRIIIRFIGSSKIIARCVGYPTRTIQSLYSVYVGYTNRLRSCISSACLAKFSWQLILIILT